MSRKVCMMRTRMNIASGLGHKAARLLRGGVALVASILLSVSLCTVALAAQEATLTLMMSYDSGSGEQPISGVTATVYRVAVLDDAVNNYELVDTFSSLGINFNNGLDAAGMDSAAQKAAGIVSSSGVKGTSATSDAQGRISYGSLPYGVYLVVQTDSTGDATNYEDFRPFLISVPQITNDGVVYDVIANPKTAPTPPPPPPPAPRKVPRTGDMNDPDLQLALMGVGGAMVLAALVFRHVVSRKNDRKS